MELLLNLAWLLVATGAIVLWLRQRGGGTSTARRGLLLQSVALACALTVLFPAISATDDLHAAQLAVEASDVARKALRSMNTVSSASAVDWLHLLPAILLMAVIAAVTCRFMGTVQKPRALRLRIQFFPLVEGRAPPASQQA